MSTGKGPNTAAWTFLKYVDEVYIPAKRESRGMTTKTGDWIRHIANCLQRFAGRPMKLRELNERRLTEFEEWSIADGCTARTSRRRVEMVKSVLRHWRPDDHPRMAPGSGNNMQFLEADVPESLEQLFLQRYLPERPAISSPHTVRQYGRCIRKFTEFLGRTAKLGDLTDANVGRFLRHRVAEGAVARTANGEAKQLKALWNWAAKKRLVPHFPTIGKLPEPEIVPRAWTREQLQQLIAACHRQPGKFNGVPAADYWVAFHLVQWDTGERTGAMRALAWDMLDEKTGHLTVPAEVRKGRLKAMVYRLKPATIAALRKLRRPDREAIFAGMDEGVFYIRYKRLIKSAGLDYVVGKSGPQKMRRTFASFITAAGGDATAALRHSTRRVTEESYNDPAIANPEPPNVLLFDLEATA